MDDNTGKRLEKIEFQLDEIKETLSKMAVQDEKISRIQAEISSLWKKYDDLSTRCNTVALYQASCPRSSLKWVYVFQIPMGLALLGMAFKTFGG
jgi:hypothetical protein